MIVREIMRGIDCIMSIDWQRKRFDELVPLPEGTTYNAYLVRGSEKTALIDSTHPSLAGAFIDALRRHGVDKIDYLVANHAEPDHAGAIPALLAAYPEARVLANVKCRSLLRSGLGVANEAITAKHKPMTPSLRSVEPRGSWSNELPISHRTLHR